MHPTKITVPASAVSTGDVLCFTNPRSEVKIETITHREVDGRIGFHANDDTWVNHYGPDEKVVVMFRKGLAPAKVNTCRYGPGGALVTDEALAGFDLTPLPNSAAKFYGGKYLIAESMSRKTAFRLAQSLGLAMTN